MAAKGTEAKLDVMNRIKAAFGEDFIGEVDKKIYVWGNEGGGKVQIALAMTCPKTPVVTGETMIVSTNGRMDFEASTMPVVNRAATTEITPEERATVAEMMARLGL